MSPYIDKSDNEYSIHCLTEDDIELLTEGLNILFNKISKNNFKEIKRRIIELKKALENGQ